VAGHPWWHRVTAAAAVLGCSALMIVTAPFLAESRPRPSAPDVVIFLTDDQRADSLADMSALQADVVRRGTSYDNAMVPTSQCCPSRASLLTGRYAHDTGVWSNHGRWGGWRRFAEQGMEHQTIATALHDHGYLTAFLGKYLNSFGRDAPPGYVPPGWDEFDAFATADSSGAYFDYRLSDGSEHGEGPASYSTDLLARHAAQIIRGAPVDRPMFLYFAPYAPHRPFTPPPRYAPLPAPQLLTILRSTAAEADDQSRQPRWLRKVVPPTVSATLRIKDGQDRALQALDDAVGRLVRALRQAGRLHNTLFVFMSDNGLMRGEHGLTGKNVPYQAATRVPMVIRWDGRVAAGGTDHRLALNLDVAATIAAATGVRMKTDGLNLLGDVRRRGFPLEAIRKAAIDRPAYCGWRTHRYLYVRYADGDQELYDYRTDPGEHRNRALDPRYRSRVKRLRQHARTACRPMPPGFRWSAPDARPARRPGSRPR
jgi:N-acetylglucosamine-6-sulfatase